MIYLALYKGESFTYFGRSLNAKERVLKSIFDEILTRHIVHAKCLLDEIITRRRQSLRGVSYYVRF